MTLVDKYLISRWETKSFLASPTDKHLRMSKNNYEAFGKKTYESKHTKKKSTPVSVFEKEHELACKQKAKAWKTIE